MTHEICDGVDLAVSQTFQDMSNQTIIVNYIHGCSIRCLMKYPP